MSWLSVPPGRARRLVPSPVRNLATQLHFCLHRVSSAKISAPGHASYHVPPDAEHIRLTHVWVVELLTSSTVESALRAMRRAGFGRDDEDIDEWLADVRGRAPFEGSRSLGTYTRTGTTTMFGQARKAKDLPRSFDRVELRISSVTRTVTAVRALFTLSDHAAGEIERILRAPHRDRIIRLAGGAIGTDSGESVARQAVLSWRQGLRRDARRWLRRRAPGVFAASRKGDGPTAELVLVDVDMPLQGRQSGPTSRWQHAAGLDSLFGSLWIFTNPTGLRAMVPLGFEGAGTRHAMLLAGSVRHMSYTSVPTLPVRTGLDALRTMLQDLDVDGLVYGWALRSLLEVWEAQGSLARDLSSRRWSRWRPVAALEGLRRYMRTVAIDVAVSAGELGDLVDPAGRGFLWEFPELLPAPSEAALHETLAGAMRREYAERLPRIERLIGRLSDTLETIAAVTAAAVGVRLQRRALFIAGVAIAIAVVGIIVAIRAHK